MMNAMIIILNMYIDIHEYANVITHLADTCVNIYIDVMQVQS
jgi:hypothetical protein